MRSVFLTSACLVVSLANCALAILPASLPVEGVLLTELPLAEGLGLGVYGPKPAHADEPTIVSVIIRVGQGVAISFGLILMEYQEAAVKLKETLLPWGSYAPSDLWATDGTSGWQQLLLQWVISTPQWLPPGSASVLRDWGEHNQIGIAFIIDGAMRDPAGTRGGHPSIPGPDEAPTPTPAHSVKISFPLVLKDPGTTLNFWVALSVDGKLLLHAVPPVQMVPPQAKIVRPTPESKAPVLDEPAEGAVVREEVVVAGETKPGTLAVAWLEIYDPAHPEERSREPPVRRITDSSGRFQIPLPIPSPDAPQQAGLIYELHVCSEAPGYKSPETVRKLRVKQANL